MYVKFIKSINLFPGSELTVKTDNPVAVLNAADMLSALKYIEYHALKCKSTEELDRCLDVVRDAIEKAPYKD